MIILAEQETHTLTVRELLALVTDRGGNLDTTLTIEADGFAAVIIEADLNRYFRPCTECGSPAGQSCRSLDTGKPLSILVHKPRQD
jgi:hypothetical protein